MLELFLGDSALSLVSAAYLCEAREAEEVVFGLLLEGVLRCGAEGEVGRQEEAFVVAAVNGLGGGFAEGFSVDVFSLDAADEALVL